MNSRRGARPVRTGRWITTLRGNQQCLAIEVDFSLPGPRVVRVLERLIELYGAPEVIVVDNGSEFTGRALDVWAYQHGIKLHFIRPGHPVENAYIESFNGKFRDECLNENWFIGIGDAREVPVRRTT